MIKIERRYEYRSREGTKWTDWFAIKRFENDQEADDYIKSVSKQKEADKKLKGEYRIVK